MSRIGTAFRAFFRALLDHHAATELGQCLSQLDSGVSPTKSLPAASKPERKPVTSEPTRSEALSLLEALQREARFVDFIQEDLSSYSDQQIGAAARDVHRGCATVLERMFAPKPIREEAEGTPIELSAGYEPTHYKLTGNVTDSANANGELIHPGWRATRVELPKFTGGGEAVHVIAPAEIELK